MTHASHNATNSNNNSHTANEEITMSTTDTMINTITAAINAATDRGDENYAAVAASRGNGSATPNWLTCDDLRAVIDEIEDGEDWYVVEDEDEIADVLGDARDVMGNDADTVAAWTVLVRVHSGEYVTASDPREYVIVWSYGGEDAVGDIDEVRPVAYRVANEFPALGDRMATYHATEADATEAAAGLIAILAGDIMAWGELTPVAPTGDAAEVAAMREAYDLAASASDDAINNAGVVRMTREAAELIAARAVSITRIDAI